MAVVETLYDDAANDDYSTNWSTKNLSFTHSTDHYVSVSSTGTGVTESTTTGSNIVGIKLDMADIIDAGDGGLVMAGIGEGGYGSDNTFDIVDDGYYFIWRARNDGDIFRLYKVISGTATQLADTSGESFSHSTYYTLELFIDSGDVVVKLDGNEVHRETDSSYTPTANTALRVGNRNGASNGSEVGFKNVYYLETAGGTAPTVTTQAVTSITDTTATGNGNVTDDGGETITERGVCWNTSGTPTTSDSTATSAGTTGAFTASMTGLTSNTFYYVRAYAINSEGTSYGEEVTFRAGGDPENLTFSNITDHSMTLSWTPGGDGDRSLIVMKKGSAPTSTTDGTVVYNNTGSEVTVYNLDAGSRYYFKIWANNPTYSLDTENDDTTAGVPLNVAVGGQYIFVGTSDTTDGVEVRHIDTPGTVVANISPAQYTDTTVGATSLDAKGHYLAFATHTTQYVYIYEFINENDYTLLHSEDLSGATGNLRACHIDDELEYVYFGDQSGNIVYYDLATFTKTIYALASDDIRYIDTNGDQMVVASNDDKIYDVDRSTRTSMSDVTVNDYGFNMENARVDDNYIYDAGDNSTVTIRNNTSPYTSQDTLTDPGNDITYVGISDPDYLFVSSDDHKLYIYDRNDSNALETTITSPTANVEDMRELNGSIYYVSGVGSPDATKLYWRTFLSNSTAGSPIDGSTKTTGDSFTPKVMWFM